MNIGKTIRTVRLQKGLSQRDMEKRTGILRCYLSHVENGHNTPSLNTLAKLAAAMEVPLARFFTADPSSDKGCFPLLSKAEIHLLAQVRCYSSNLDESDRKLILEMVKKMAATTTASS